MQFQWMPKKNLNIDSIEITKPKRKQTVREEDLDLYHYLFSFSTPKEERDFFRCECNHLSLEHDSNGECNRNCDCKKLNLIYQFVVSRLELVDSNYWKACERFISKMFSNERAAENVSDNLQS